MAIDLVCVGACYLDTILRQVSFPKRWKKHGLAKMAADEDSKLRASNLQVRRGGNCPNTLEVLQQLLRQEQGARLGGRVIPHLVTCLPSRNAPATVRIIESFGVDTSIDFSQCIFRDENEEPASSYIIRSSATGSRTLVNYNNLAEMSFDEFVAAAESLGSEDAWFHFEVRKPIDQPFSMKGFSKAQRSKACTGSNPGDDVAVHPMAEAVKAQDEMAEADVVFFSRSWAESKLYTSAEQCLHAQSAKARRGSRLFCTWGSQGAACSSPDGATVSCLATQPGQMIRVIDTVGAGDTFIAGILFGFLHHDYDWDSMAKLSFAVQLATCKVQQEGFNDLGFKAPRRLAVASSSTSRLEVDK
ncbi:hypothetical protein E0Z10_g2602 [Xylaria hypoxylon]|uniref:Carbohydrate kinase PfkB domain-containing protein n=1 Tax=Xylaria hypoxylon TaxID=37992 RepID=A0A4Z0Z3Z5_9PEZI|nr:hypothetical protein E0Z10_g2602 [Xylaria hypoxylon]